MSGKQILGVVLVIIGILGLIYGQFSYTKETHQTKLGPLEFSVAEKEQVNIPQWLSVGAAALGIILLVWRKPS
jgi:drug/metabolite transporter (DMT)-like permease